MTNQIFYNMMSVEKKREIRKTLQFSKEHLKQQKALVEDNLVAAMNERIGLMDKFLHSEISLEQYVKRVKKLGDYILSFFVAMESANKRRKKK